MSFLFHKNTQKAIRWIWGGIAILIVVSMVLTYSGGPAAIAEWFQQ
jgi:uncharacterized membrane protein SpoIIM required for sporulation